jgi:hypothetical protein
MSTSDHATPAFMCEPSAKLLKTLTGAKMIKQNFLTKLKQKCYEQYSFSISDMGVEIQQSMSQ